MAFTTGTDLTIAAKFTTGTNLIVYSSGELKVSNLVPGTFGLPGTQVQSNVTSIPNSQIASGVFGLTSSALNSSKANLIGYLVDLHNVKTRDQYYLSDQLDTLVVDFYPYHAFYTDLTKVAVTLTDNLPVELEHWELTNSPNQLGRSYLFDYYYRFHFEYTTINIGNVLSVQTYNVHIWNAFFESKYLADIATVNLDNVTFNFAEGVPFTYPPLYTSNSLLSVEAVGDPVINGYFQFSLGGVFYNLYVNGQRVILWPFCPNREFSETREWLTDVIKAGTAEQRFALREVPRQTLDYKFINKTQQEYVHAKLLADSITQYALGMPVWTNVYQVTIASGDNTIYLTTAYSEIAVDDPVVIWQNYLTYELASVVTIYSDRIVIDKNLSTVVGTAYLAPVIVGYHNGVTFNIAKDNTYGHDLAITSTKSFYQADITSYQTYKTLPVIDDIPLMLGLGSKHAREQLTVDSETGPMVKFDVEFYNRETYFLALGAKNKQELYSVRRKLDYLQGKYRAFWVTNNLPSFVPVTDILPGTNFFYVSTASIRGFTTKYIRIVAQTTVCEMVTAITVDPSDATRTMIMVENSYPSGLLFIRQVEILKKVRSDADRIEAQHEIGKFTTVKVPLIEVAN